MLFTKTYGVKIMEDATCRATLLLTIIAYFQWFAFLVLIYPLQFSETYVYAKYIPVLIFGSFLLLCVMAFYLARIFHHRIYQLRVKNSREKFHTQMKELNDEWNFMKAKYHMTNEEIYG